MFLNYESSMGHFFKFKIFICEKQIFKKKKVIYIANSLADFKSIFLYSTRNTPQKVKNLQK